jgi:ketosteroid isomerase-like protein
MTLSSSLPHPGSAHRCSSFPGVSRSNLEIIKEAHERLATEGVDALLEYIHPDFVGVAPPELSVEPQTYRGPAGFKRWFDSFHDAVDEVRIEPEEYIAAGELVVTPARIVIRGHGSGIEVAQRVTWVWTLRDGLAIRVDAYADKDAALRALGVSAES